MVSWWHIGGARINKGSEEHFHVTQHVLAITQRATHSLSPWHTHLVSLTNRGGGSSDSVPLSRLQPLISLFLESVILGTLASAQCKLFSLACQRQWANHKSQMVSGYFIWVTVVKHQCTESFWKHTNIRFHYLWLGERVFDFEFAQWGPFLLLFSNVHSVLHHVTCNMFSTSNIWKDSYRSSLTGDECKILDISKVFLLSICLYLSIYLSRSIIHRFIFQSIHPFIFLSMHPPIHPSICPFALLSVWPTQSIQLTVN